MQKTKDLITCSLFTVLIAIGAFIKIPVPVVLFTLQFLFTTLAGLLIVYAAGMVYYYVICNYVIDTPIALGPLFLHCFLLAVPGDICLCMQKVYIFMRKIKS